MKGQNLLRRCLIGNGGKSLISSLLFDFLSYPSQQARQAHQHPGCSFSHLTPPSTCATRRASSLTSAPRAADTPPRCDCTQHRVQQENRSSLKGRTTEKCLSATYFHQPCHTATETLPFGTPVRDLGPARYQLERAVGSGPVPDACPTVTSG